MTVDTIDGLLQRFKVLSAKDRLLAGVRLLTEAVAQEPALKLDPECNSALLDAAKTIVSGRLHGR